MVRHFTSLRALWNDPAGTLDFAGARDILWEDVAHVIAGKEQKVRFAQTLFE